MTCRNICERYKAKFDVFAVGRYASGQKRCQHCDIFIEWSGARCPCCGRLLRTKSYTYNNPRDLPADRKERKEVIATAISMKRRGSK